ncbi:hypothetical protein Poly30_47310 [Planctomycetes bacterium Poly30]|uniref:Uncharacterized protein n=1 Tax=Saltatorellus ferox TaxID=2528018 RepID=A0A518EYP7_9BACT|nr:hypothetical protein Poly30_47310 [Planctomycetes bacterium Poly30]
MSQPKTTSPAHSILAWGFVAALFALAGPASGSVIQRSAEKPSVPSKEVEAVPGSQAERIAWFGRWEDARAEAARTRRPILLMSAAPQCSGAPGMW